MRHAPFPPLWTAVPPLRGGTIPPPTEKLKMKPWDMIVFLLFLGRKYQEHVITLYVNVHSIVDLEL